MIKRIFDIIVSLIGLLFLFPIIAVLWILIRFKIGKPVFFCQDRPGLNAKIFKLVKFRTMLNSTNSKGELLSDSERLTPFGAKLRRTSLDELPSLWNVLKGDMSLVGPRPLLVEYLPLYSAQQAKRHNVRPGVTGWAQINGRNAISWDDKFKLDQWYVENGSFVLDLKILLLTVKKVVKKENISSNTHVTMEKFRGSYESKNESKNESSV